MIDHSAVAVFDQLDQAQRALDSLKSTGIPRDHMTVVHHELESKDELHGLVSGTDQNVVGGISGFAIGGTVGLLLGLGIMGLVRMTGTGAGLSMGILAGGVMGFVLAGIVFGGLIGAMTGRGVKQARIEPYDEQVRSGKSLVIAHGSHDQMMKAQVILQSSGARSARVHHRVLAPVDSTEAV